MHWAHFIMHTINDVVFSRFESMADIVYISDHKLVLWLLLRMLMSDPQIHVCVSMSSVVDKWCSIILRSECSPHDLLQWLRGLGLSELQCSEPGWLVRQGVGSSPTSASMSSQVSACYEIKFSSRYRGFACVLFKLWQAITPGSGASGVWWEPPVWITDGRGQRSHRKTA